MASSTSTSSSPVATSGWLVATRQSSPAAFRRVTDSAVHG